MIIPKELKKGMVKPDNLAVTLFKLGNFNSEKDADI
jgi:hypothetical protein